jgi:hypothetical protein
MFSYYRKLVKTTIKADRLASLSYIDENLKTQPKHFRKFISKFKKNDQAVTQLELGTKIITETQSIAEEFTDHFSCVFDTSCRPKAPYYFEYTCSDILNVPYIYDSDVKRAYQSSPFDKISRPR